MDILTCILSGFIAAVFIPWLHRTKQTATGWILALLPLGITLYLLSYLPLVMAGDTVQISLPWVPALEASFAFYIDGLSLLFALLVTGIGSLIFSYSASYIAEETHGGRFYSYMLVFMAAMLGLVLADNILTLYVFFELTSLASFLLIGFESEKEEARRAARQALLVTNIGGLALLAGVLLAGEVIGTYQISELITAGEEFQATALYVPVLLLILMAAFTKSAQFPFYFWLPNAMEAPTPVSAYLHSATMVKAGIYVLARFSPLLAGTPIWQLLVTGFGAATMLLGGWLALKYVDMKRILAYLTIMALGLITMLFGIGTEEAVAGALAYIVAHACYKAPLFMVAGTVEHETGSREVTDLRGLARFLPFTFAAAALSAGSMAGLPPFLGFIGKEIAYDVSLHAPLSHLVITTAVVANIALVAAAGVLALRPFLGELPPSLEPPHRPAFGLWVSPAVLAILGLLFGMAPGLIDTSLITPALSAVRAEAGTADLQLWHGLTPALGLSIATVLTGLGVYAGWNRIRTSRSIDWLGRILGSGLDRAYTYSEHGLLTVASRLTRLLQHGYLRYYLTVTFAASLLLMGYPLALYVNIDWIPAPPDILLHEGVTVTLTMLVVVAAVFIRSNLGTVLAITAGSMGVTLIYLFFGAPDVALTRLIIEILISILVVIAFIGLPDRGQISRVSTRLWNAVIALGVGVVMTMLTLAVLTVPFQQRISQYYIDNAYVEAHSRNIVNVILVDFRAFDTLGEITVLVTAGISIYALIRLSRTDRENATENRQQ